MDVALSHTTRPHASDPLAQLKGFSVAPGSAVDVHIRPALFRITESALHRFDYLQRRCADTSVDKGVEDLDGMDGDNSYSLSNFYFNSNFN